MKREEDPRVSGYERPTLTVLEVDMHKTDVLAGCQGWKDGTSNAVRAAAAVYRADEIEEITWTGEGSERFVAGLGVVRRTIMGQNLLIPTRGPRPTAHLFLLNSTAAAAWDLAVEGRPICEIAGALAPALGDQERAGLTRDLTEIVGEFVRWQLLAADAAPGSRSPDG
jgi:hypothetical protein